MVQIVRRTGPKKKPVEWQIPIDPVPYAPKEIKKRIAIFDTETDPFAPGRVVKPFTCGFYLTDTDEYFDFWGDDCIDQFFRFLATKYADTEFLILVHNGGNFDFYFFVDYFDSGHSPFIINGRLVRVMAQGQEFRDSYSMVPVALGEYDKIEIDYAKFEADVRHLHEAEIRAYQKRDCTALGELVTSWYEMFGDKLTMASVALPTLRSFHGFETVSETIDREMRPYYFGGRNQCFATGVLYGDFKVYDINSSYPDVMRRYKHPISDTPKYEPKITERTHFAYIRAWSLGALPVRNADGGLSFPIGTGDFYACIHEINAGLATKTLRIIKVHHSIYFEQQTDFSEFIDRFYDLRLSAAASGDEIRKLFYKLVMNSSYGKFAQDPRKYENWLFDPEEIPTPRYCNVCHDNISKKLERVECATCDAKESDPYGWYLHTTRDGRNIYASPQRIRAGSFYNVATAASITSAARASLLYGIQSAVRPVYCDTDSVICEGFEPRPEWPVRIHDKQLGAWKSEADGDVVAIAGKKLYAVLHSSRTYAMDYARDNGKRMQDIEELSIGFCIKKASKGVKLTASEIVRVCNGETIEYANPVPKFSMDKEPMFVTRNIRRTG